ncbi:MAG TPA: hypothetical protein DCL54_19400 [Alphaproteobacteria bacterium]|nr:hypothetical protein [Alphaproteobacteria bacterium]HAJ48750.1 hypothetical protein [Alphaproteobacteria bacterium]
MGSYTLSVEAEADIRAIAAYTAHQWGLAKAESYSDGLHAELERLAAQPSLGRAFSEERPDYLRRNYEQHAIFFRIVRDGVFIVRVLHSRMDILRHL